MLNLMINVTRREPSSRWWLLRIKKGRPLGKLLLRATGRQEVINGYETEEYICDAPADLDALLGSKPKAAKPGSSPRP